LFQAFQSVFEMVSTNVEIKTVSGGYNRYTFRQGLIQAFD